MRVVKSHSWVIVSGGDPSVTRCSTCGATGFRAWRPFDPYRIGPRYHPLELDAGVDPDCDVQTVRSVLSA